MSSAQHYADPRAFEEYEENDGQEVVVTALVNLSTGDALDAWLQHAWVAAAGFTEVAPGDGSRGRIGHTRQLPLGGAVEQIVSAGLPNDHDVQLIPSICYKLREFGPLLPLQDHIGFVRFVPADSASAGSSASVNATNTKTLVLWSVKITPTAAGNVFLCGGSLLRVAMRAVLNHALSGMLQAVHAMDTAAAKHE